MCPSSSRRAESEGHASSTRVDIATDGHDWCQQAKLVENIRGTDVAGVDDAVAPPERLDGLGAKHPCYPDDADCFRHRSFALSTAS